MIRPGLTASLNLNGDSALFHLQRPRDERVDHEEEEHEDDCEVEHELAISPVREQHSVYLVLSVHQKAEDAVHIFRGVVQQTIVLLRLPFDVHSELGRLKERHD